MKLIHLFLAIFFSAQVYGQFQYNEQRQKEADRYLESIRKGREYSNTKNSEFKMNEQAVQEMTDMWKRRAGKKTSAELEAERIANQKKWEANREEREAIQRTTKELREKKAFLKEVAATVAQMNAARFVSAGFTAPEAVGLAMESVGSVKTGNETVREIYDERSDRALQAYTTFLKKEATGNFEELMDLVADFDIAGYTAVKSLERLKKRFPGKKDVIDVAIPFHGINYWRVLGAYTIIDDIVSASAYLLAGETQNAEMNELLKSWLKASPQLIEKIYGDNETFEKLLNDLIKKQDKEFLHHFALSAAIALPYYPTVLKRKTKEIPSLRQLFTFDDFEMIRRYNKISGIQAIEKVRGMAFMNNHFDFLEASDFEADLYTEELKKYADMGDAEAMNAYGLHTLKGHTKDAKEAAYPYLKRAADNGLPYALDLLAKYKNLKQLGIDNWGIYKRVLEFKKEFNEEERVYLRSGSNQTPNFFGKEQPFTPDRKMKIPQPGKPQDTIYYYGSIKNGKADGYGYGIDASDNLYSGYWKDNQYNGPGKLVTGDGHLYEGMFANGKKNGYVYYNYQKKGDGPFHSGLYENDKLVEKGKKYRPLTGWRILADKEYNWNFSGIPANFENMRRRINADNILEFKSTDDGYSWAISDVNNYKPAAYSFEALYKIDKKGYKNGTCGILIDIDEGNGKDKSKLLYMIHPGKQAFCLRLYNPNTDDWIYYTNPDPENGWLTSNFFRDYDNWVRLDKLGDDIFLYLNDKLVFTQNISTSGKPLHNFAGIGIVQGGEVSGTIPKIIFK
ncbi:MORN repeat-containing protein [Pedobacter sp.]